jgi:hypothetical protein
VRRRTLFSIAVFAAMAATPAAFAEGPSLPTPPANTPVVTTSASTADSQIASSGKVAPAASDSSGTGRCTTNITLTVFRETVDQPGEAFGYGDTQCNQAMRFISSRACVEEFIFGTWLQASCVPSSTTYKATYNQSSNYSDVAFAGCVSGEEMRTHYYWKIGWNNGTTTTRNAATYGALC